MPRGKWNDYFDIGSLCYTEKYRAINRFYWDFSLNPYWPEMIIGRVNDPEETLNPKLLGMD